MLAEARPRIAAAGRQRGHQHLARHHRQPHRRSEKLLLAAVEMMYQRGVYPGRGRDRPDRRSVITAIGELGAGGRQDRLAGAALADPAPGTARPAGLRLRMGSHAGSSVVDLGRASWKKRSSRVAGASYTRAPGPPTPPRARRTSAGAAPGTRSARPTSATGIRASSSAPNAAAQAGVSTTVTRAAPMISGAVPWSTTRPSAMITRRVHSPASSM